MEELNRQDVTQIIEQRLKELRLDSLFEIFVREHNPLDGTHKENIGKYVRWADILDVPSSFSASGHSHDDRYFTETESGAIEIPVFVPVDAPTVIALTWDGAQNTLDLTAQTSAYARWALLSVKAARTADFTDPFYWYTYAGNLIATIASNQIGSENYQISGFGCLPLDSEQRIKYDAPASTNSRECYLYGYIEIRTLGDLI